MIAQITKSPAIALKDRSQVIIHRDLHFLIAMEAAKQRVKPKDMITHFCESGLQNLGVDVSGVVEEPEHKEVA